MSTIVQQATCVHFIIKSPNKMKSHDYKHVCRCRFTEDFKALLAS